MLDAWRFEGLIQLAYVNILTPLHKDAGEAGGSCSMFGGTGRVNIA
jgi:hypothetical protein